MSCAEQAADPHMADCEPAPVGSWTSALRVAGRSLELQCLGS